jgi:protein involved in polysaccharide export with SLBB domain
MNLMPPSLQFLPSHIRAMAFFGYISAFLVLSAATRAAEPPQAIAQSNSVASGPNSNAATNALPNSSQLGTNRLEAAPITGAAAAATNLSETGATNSAVVLDDKYKLAIGDRLSLRILEDEDGPKPLFVTDSGDLEVPYIGRVPAENKTCKQLASEIKAALDKTYYYNVTVIIAVDLMIKNKSTSNGRVYLVGAVRLPGPVEFPSDEVLTLSRAVLRAGSFTEYADRRHVKVTRKPPTSKDNKTTFIVDVGEIFDKGKIETDLTLQPGDLIYVPDRLIHF